MQNILTDVIRYTHDLGEFEAFKVIVAEDGSAKVKSSSKDLSIILEASVKEPMSSLKNDTLEAGKKTTVGFSRLNVLSGYVKSPVFSGESATLDVHYNKASGAPSEMEFNSGMGHKCTYRFMNPEAVKQKVKTFRLANADSLEYDITFTPSENFVKDFQSFASILGKFTSEFSFLLKDGTLYMTLGDDDTATIPVLETDCQTLNSVNSWPIKQVLSILKQAPSLDAVTFNISDEFGLINIDVDTDHAKYSYTLSAA